MAEWLAVQAVESDSLTEQHPEQSNSSPDIVVSQMSTSLFASAGFTMAIDPDGRTEDVLDSQQPIADEQLLQQLHAGDQQAATEIYVRYADKLLGIARRHTGEDLRTRFDPEDVVQSVFRTFFRRAAQGAYVVPEGDDLWKLFLVIALNKIRRLGEFHRANKRSVGQTSLLNEPLVAERGPQEDDSLRILHLTIDEILADSPEHVRQMVKLRIDGCEVAEIAERVQRSKRSVERVLQNFRESLAKQLGQEGLQ